MSQDWKVLASEKVISNRWLTVRRDTCETGKGAYVADYYVIDKDSFAMVVALTADEQIVLVRQYKHGAGHVVVECPAGYINPGEEPKDAAIRELREETGYECERVIPLGTFDASPAVLSNHAHLFLCLGARLGGPQQLDATEDVQVELHDFDAAIQAIGDGSLPLDIPSIATIMLAKQWLTRFESR